MQNNEYNKENGELVPLDKKETSKEEKEEELESKEKEPKETLGF
ncbi:hypothetical protein VN1205_14590 [Helicobacter pylori]|nr:hypothetical protein VN1205_14590 [Helicobacter pylori]